jgi:ATP-dependent exoDNAse (exonuclease V) alpha subunit
VTEKHKEILLACSLEKKPDTQLFTHNADVDALNKIELAKLPGKEKLFVMEEGGIPTMVEALKRGCLSPEKLYLKVGAVVMFTRNNFNAGYVNGSIGKILKFTKSGESVVQLLSGETVIPEIAKWSIKKWREEKAYIKQIPLRLAWAITVHKSQGMSLDSARIDLKGAFEFGQGYVAISRVRTLQGLHITGINEKTFMMHPKVVEQDLIFKRIGI